MKKQWLYLAPLATVAILATESAKAYTPYQSRFSRNYGSAPQGGLPFLSDLGADSLAILGTSLLGFLTAVLIYTISSSSRKAKKDKRKFLSILFTDFWFEGFVTPGLGTILLFVLCSTFWGWSYFWIWAAIKNSPVNIAVPFLALLVGVVVYAMARAMIESLVSIAKMAESTNAILNYLNNNSQEEELQPETYVPSASLDSQRVGVFIDGKPASEDEES